MIGRQTTQDSKQVEVVARTLCLRSMRASATFDSQELEAQNVEASGRNHVFDATAAPDVIKAIRCVAVLKKPTAEMVGEAWLALYRLCHRRRQPKPDEAERITYRTMLAARLGAER